MYQRDYVLRMIEMIGDLIAAMLGLIKKGDYQKANHILENAFIDFLKQDAAFFNIIPKEKLTDELLKDHNFTNSHLEILAELFYAQAELKHAEGNPTAGIEFYEKSLLLFEFADKKSETFSDKRQSRISSVQNRIAELRGVNR